MRRAIGILGGVLLAAALQGVELHFLGTGAADHDWTRLGKDPAVRGSSGTLLAGEILIDAGATGWENLTRFGISPDRLRAIVFTHSHGDHFNAKVVRRILDARASGLEPVDIYCTPQSLAKLETALAPGSFRGHALRKGDVFTIGECRFTTLPANHSVHDPEEACFHYLIETPDGNILYAFDGAWMTLRARHLIGDRELHCIVWDATMAESGDWRAFEHNDLAMIRLMMESLRNTATVDERTVSVLDHIAFSLWPRDPEKAEELARRDGHVLARDGMKLELKPRPLTLPESLPLSETFSAPETLDTADRVFELQPWNGPKDLSAVWQVRAAETGLQWKIRVFDDEPLPVPAGEPAWKHDCIQLAFAAPDAKRSQLEFGMFLDSATGRGAVQCYIPDAKPRPCEVSVAPLPDGCEYLVTVPWTLIRPLMKEGKFRANFLVQDEDRAGRKGFLRLERGIGEHKFAREFRVFELPPELLRRVETGR